jgi:hypothetical protein
VEKIGSLLALGEPNHRPCCIVDEKLSNLSEMMYTINTLDMQLLSKENEKKKNKEKERYTYDENLF